MVYTKVKIKTWAKMEDEYGLDKYDDINCNLNFVDSMEVAMPEDRIIQVLQQGDKYLWDTGTGANEWEISQDMIEEVLSE